MISHLVSPIIHHIPKEHNDMRPHLHRHKTPALAQVKVDYELRQAREEEVTVGVGAGAEDLGVGYYEDIGYAGWV